MLMELIYTNTWQFHCYTTDILVNKSSGIEWGIGWEIWIGNCMGESDGESDGVVGFVLQDGR